MARAHASSRTFRKLTTADGIEVRLKTKFQKLNFKNSHIVFEKTTNLIRRSPLIYISIILRNSIDLYSRYPTIATIDSSNIS